VRQRWPAIAKMLDVLHPVAARYRHAPRVLPGPGRCQERRGLWIIRRFWVQPSRPHGNLHAKVAFGRGCFGDMQQRTVTIEDPQPIISH